jgi:hypothetical protein
LGGNILYPVNSNTWRAERFRDGGVTQKLTTQQVTLPPNPLGA